MDQDLKNALAFYSPAPEGDYIDLGATWQWVWEVLQGDFHENPTAAQTITGAVITAIPFVDQLGDARDFIANCRKIDKDPSDTWAWVALALTLVGMIPVLGSLMKGALKVMFFYLRKNLFRLGRKIADKHVIDEAIQGLDRYLQMPAVRWTLGKLEIHAPYQYIADKLVLLRPLVTQEALLKALDQLMQTVRQMMDRMMRWAPRKTRRQVEEAWGMLLRVRRRADEELAKAVKPVQDVLDQLVNRLRVESDTTYRAWVGKNTHVMDGGVRTAGQRALIERGALAWVYKGNKPKFVGLEKMNKEHNSAVLDGWPDVSGSPGPLGGQFKNFDSSMRATFASPGEKLYRVVDPTSNDNSFFWLREADFLALNGKDQWRSELAVWKHWNENGEFLVYTVPPGKPMKVWEGRAASQQLEPGSENWLEGGRTQVLIDPATLDVRFVSPRQKTGWGFDDGTGIADLDPVDPFIGVPKMSHKWYSSDQSRG